MLDNVNILKDVPSEAWALLAGAGVVTFLLQAVKKWLAVQNEKLITFFLTAFSFLAVAFESLNSAVMDNPGLIGKNTVAIMGITQLLYRFVVKPASTLFGDAKKYRLQLEEQKKVDAEIKAVDASAALVETPTVPTPVSTTFDA